MEEFVQPPPPKAGQQPIYRDLPPGSFIDLPPARPNLIPRVVSEPTGLLGAVLAAFLLTVLWRISLNLTNCHWFFQTGPNSAAREFTGDDLGHGAFGMIGVVPLVAYAFLGKYRDMRVYAMLLAVLPAAYVLWTTAAHASDPVAFWANRC